MEEILIYSEDYTTLCELLSKGKSEAEEKNIKVSAICSEKLDEVEKLFKYGADKVYVIKDLNELKLNPEKLTAILQKIISNIKPIAVILDSTKNNRETAARIAAKYKTGCITDCINFKIEENGELSAERMVYASKATAFEKIKGKPAVLTIPRRSFKAEMKWNNPVEIEEVEVKIEKTSIKVLETDVKKLEGKPLEEAEILIVLGRGVKRKEDCNMIGELAELLKGQVSCSRPIAADLKWFNEWIGLSGHKVKPKLYIGIGVSGAIQHLAGIQGAKIIVAINKDSEAPIISAADYAIIGDLYQVIPKLIENLRKRKAEQYK